MMLGAAAATAALSAPSAAQQLDDIILVEWSFTEVQFVLFTDTDMDGAYATAGETRALYNNGLNDSTLTSQRNMEIRTEGANTVTYWVDSVIDAVFRGRDVNGDGVINVGEETKFRDSLNLDGASRANDLAFTPDGAVWWDSDRTPHIGIFRLFDGNGDDDANDAGEQIVYVDGNFNHPIDTGGGTVNITAGTFERMAPAGNGVVVFNNFDHSATFRFEDLNVDQDVLDPNESIVFLNATGENASLPQHPDFAASGAGSDPRNMVVDPTAGTYGWLRFIEQGFEGPNEVWYTACDSSSTSQFSINQFGEPINGLIFRCVDNNMDGDVNDPGEVNTFYDGSGTVISVECYDKIIGMTWENGWLYVCELNNNSTPGHPPHPRQQRGRRRDGLRRAGRTSCGTPRTSCRTRPSTWAAATRS